MTRSESMALWESVKANHATLDACVGPHDFSVEADRVGRLVRRYRCTKCQGTIDHVDRIWYQRGVEHGRRGEG